MHVNNTTNKYNPELLRYLETTIDTITMRLRQSGMIEDLNIYSSIQ
jgi:hypothetical protein